LRVTARALSIAAIAACGHPPPSKPTPEDRIAIVAAESGIDRVRLVAIDERGDRRFELTQAGPEQTRDTNPAISPDGRWVVFASTRGRRDGTSLWIAPLAAEAQPHRLTGDGSIDSHPTWTPDGRAIVFASTRDGGDFDLWRQDLVDGAGRGPAVQLTNGPGHEVTPTVARDGTIVYAAITPKTGGEIESHLEERTPEGTIRQLTSGPADSSPAFSPDGGTIVFARPEVRGESPDSELWWTTRSGDPVRRVIDLPLTDESGPVWSRDGRFVFATSLYRPGGKPLFSAVIHVDLREPTPHARMLEDSAGATARLTPAIGVQVLDAAALHRDPEYLPELAKIMAQAIAKQKQERP
jgi:Tol biopolymer transport system component